MILIIFGLFLLYALRTILFETYLWQLKEYRFDRMLSHLSTNQGRRLFLNLSSFAKWIILILTCLLYLSGGKILLLLPVGIVYVIELVRTFNLIKSGRLRLPKFTIKAICVIALAFLLILVAVSVIPNIIIILVLDRLLSLIVFMGILVMNGFSALGKQFIVRLAAKRINAYPDILVIGITGSYGKTSTKEFLASILAKKFRVLKTEGYNNTEIGVAQTIIRRLSSAYDVFVVEMGAYKKGEITAICNIVKPKVGIITGINQQHLQLFGTIAKTMEAKFELIKRLSRNGIAVFNGGNTHVQTMIDWVEKLRPDLKIWEYSKEKGKVNVENTKQLDKGEKVYATDIKVEPEKLFFRVRTKKESIICQANLIGVQNVENLLAAICVAYELGLSSSQIKKAIERVETPQQTMKLIRVGKARLIDDSFNANPDGVKASLEYLKLCSGRKIMVLTPLIELGSMSSDIHRSLGKLAADICDLILLTNLNYYQSFIAGASLVSGGREKVKLISKETMISLSKSNLNNSMIIFEGKEAGKVLKQLTNNPAAAGSRQWRDIKH